ncbi:MAG: heavy metal translocating P-type ATPase [Anaerolineae bacterium]
MIFKKWLANELKPTVVCVSVSVIALSFSLGGWLKDVLPVDIAWIAIILCGVPIVVGAGTALVTEHDIKADVLVSIALIASVATSEFFAAGEVALIMQIGSLLEDFTANRARKGIEGLIKLTPKTTRVKRDGTELTIPVEEVVVSDIVTVIAGETIPVDGILLSGETSVDQSVMTGESIPVDKKAGDTLTSGTVNQLGTFEMRATKACADSSLQRMIALAEEADANKAPIVGLADRWASWMVGVALACAVAVGLVSGEVMRAVTILVVFCPCAFILATPTAVAAAIGNLTKYGILIRTGDALERLSKIQWVAFDKTGTLTYGRPEVVGVESFAESISPSEVLRVTALAEQRSEHPLGKAIVKRYMEQSGVLADISDFKVHAGQGVSADVEGNGILAGKPELFEGRGAKLDEAKAIADKYYKQGATVIFVEAGTVLLGLIALADTVRSDSGEAVSKLKTLNITPMLLTGDNKEAAESIAAKVGITEVRSDLLPQEKMKIIKDCDAEGKEICMVGDGVNDALALSSAYAGIAMGGVGSDIAVESADAVLVSDDIKRLPYLFRITRKTMQKVKQNIIISLTINFIAIVVSGLGILTPITAALVHNFGSVFVVVNAALLLQEKDR